MLQICMWTQSITSKITVIKLLVYLIMFRLAQACWSISYQIIKTFTIDVLSSWSVEANQEPDHKCSSVLHTLEKKEININICDFPICPQRVPVNILNAKEKVLCLIKNFHNHFPSREIISGQDHLVYCVDKIHPN